MGTEKQQGGFRYWANRLWHNYVVRNILLAAVFTAILMAAAALLLNIFTRHNKYKEVPDFVGLSLDEAAGLAKTDKLRIEVNDSLYVPSYASGVILKQNPVQGSQVKSGRRIFVTVNSSRPKMVSVPYVVDMSLGQAKNNLEVAGLIVERLVYVNDIATNYVLDQRLGNVRITKGNPVRAEMGSGVTLAVGRGSDARPATVPRVTGMAIGEARSRIIDAGLNVGQVSYGNEVNALNQRSARVYAQTPEPNRSYPLGSEVTLRLTTDSATLVQGIRRTEDAAHRAQQREQELADSLAATEYFDVRTDGGDTVFGEGSISGDDGNGMLPGTEEGGEYGEEDHDLTQEFFEE